MRTGHITEANKPTAGKANSAVAVLPKSAAVSAALAPRGADQHLAAVDELQQPQAQAATDREQAPEPGHLHRASRVRIDLVVLRKKLGGPVGRASLQPT